MLYNWLIVDDWIIFTVPAVLGLAQEWMSAWIHIAADHHCFCCRICHVLHDHCFCCGISGRFCHRCHFRPLRLFLPSPWSMLSKPPSKPPSKLICTRIFDVRRQCRGIFGKLTTWGFRKCLPIRSMRLQPGVIELQRFPFLFSTCNRIFDVMGETPGICQMLTTCGFWNRRLTDLDLDSLPRRQTPRPSKYSKTLLEIRIAVCLHFWARDI